MRKIYSDFFLKRRFTLTGNRDKILKENFHLKKQ